MATWSDIPRVVHRRGTALRKLHGGDAVTRLRGFDRVAHRCRSRSAYSSADGARPPCSAAITRSRAALYTARSIL